MPLKNIGILILLTVTCSGMAAGATPHRKRKRTTPSQRTTSAATRAEAAVDSDEMPVTTSSPVARLLYDRGITAWENVQTNRALEAWRQAVRKDPQFALAHLQISYLSPDPAEQATERGTAKQLAINVSSAEQLLITWLSGVREDRYVEAIAAMNDLVERFPKDKQVQLLAGSWLLRVNQYQPARKRLEAAVALDPRYSPALNDLGYACASLGDYIRATEYMQRYVASLPGEPNPEDSFAEILRMSGHFEEALEHYRKALVIDPKFHSSQLGLADSYSLMGQQRQARDAYSQAEAMAPDKITELSDELQSTFTYIRGRDYMGADTALVAVTKQAQRAELAVFAAEALRMRALLQVIQAPADLVSVEQPKKHHLFGREKKQPRTELEYLNQAENALKQAAVISESDRQDEYALLLRSRAEAAARHGMFAEANEVLKKLQAMTANSRSAVVLRAANGAQGAALAYQNRWADAIQYLEQDRENPFSLFRLAVAYQTVGHLELSQQTQAALTSFNLPTAEQSFVVPALRERMLARAR
jgi:tetratricopeptide (TPR) repeat protein